MGMKKVFILLFPQLEYKSQRDDPELFNKCIEERYIKNGYDFWVVKYKGSDLGLVSLKPDKIIDADITFQQSTPYYGTGWRYADFQHIASNLGLMWGDKVVVGGFHSSDCVEKLAKEIYKFSKKATIDNDLTELFWDTAKYTKGWDIKKYNPDLRFQEVLDCDISASKADYYLEKYSNPIWDVSKEVLNKIKKLKSDDEKTL
jgi:hypothetical protein